MKKHLLASALVASIGGLLASACNSDDSGYYYGGPSPEQWCAQYATCGTCTPVDGCGWCQTGVNQGMCAADPNECSGATAFSWTWDPSGCFPASDAGAADTAPPQGTASDSSTIPLAEDSGNGTSDANSLAH